MDAMLRLLLSLTAGGTILVLVLLLLRRLAGEKLPSSFYYYAWLLVLLRFVLPLPGLMPAYERPTASLPAEFEQAAALQTPARPWQAGNERWEAEKREAAIAPNAAVQTQGPDQHANAGAALARIWRNVCDVLGSAGFWLRIWIVGMLVSGGYYLLGYLRFRRGLALSLRRALPSDRQIYESLDCRRRPELYRSRAVSTPMLVGLLHPVLVLPDRCYSDEMLRGILRHELTHYQRRDIAFKWFAVLVTVIHWFNPITRLFRKELDRTCELACDERLLRHMDRAEKQMYGEMLLDLAADRTLPRSVVATSFAIEKRNLKERLVQIMHYKKRGRAGLALVLAAMLLLTGCGAVLGPGSPAESAAPAPTPDSSAEEVTVQATEQEAQDTAEDPGANYANAVSVHTVDEFLAAIAPSTQILLQPGTYDLSSATDYGTAHKEGCYTWEEVYDGYQLVIRDVEDLAILGGGAEDVTIAAQPRYANVLAFQGCTNPLVMMLTAGHTPDPAFCSGGVLDFESCENPYVLDCGLFGCGIVGVNAGNCRNVQVKNTEIYECSYGAVWASGCFDVRVENCRIRDCGTRKDMGFDCFDLFEAKSTTGFAVLNTEIDHNSSRILLRSDFSQDVSLQGCDIHDNKISYAAFQIQGAAPMIDSCAFTGNDIVSYYPAEYTAYAVDSKGEDLISFDLDRMERKEAVDYQGPKAPEPVAVEAVPGEDGTKEYHVKTVDEFLAAIGPDTTIYLDAAEFDLSTASSYGGYGGQYYYWLANFDGPSLVITGVSNLRIVGQGKDKTEIIAVPRYADVLYFISGENISLEGFTAGHTETGECSGDVLRFENVGNLSIRDCGLFGCGVWGIRAEQCFSVEVKNTEIYSCSSGAFIMHQCSDVTMEDLDIHDMPSDVTAYIDACDNFLYDGKLMGSGGHKL